MKFNNFINKKLIIYVLSMTVVLIFFSQLYANNFSNLIKSLNKGKIKSEQINQSDNSSNILNDGCSLRKPISFFEISKPNTSNNKNKEISPLRKVKYFTNDKFNQMSLKYSKSKNRIKDDINIKITPIKNSKSNTTIIAMSELPPSANITPITEFPGLNDSTADTKEAEAIKDINTLYEISDYFFPDNHMEALIRLQELQKIIGPYCEDNAAYPYLCALLKYYYAEIREKILGDPAESVLVHGYNTLEMFNQINETYINVGGNKADIIKKVVELSQIKKTNIFNSINKLSSKIDNNITSINKMKTNLELLKKNDWKVDYVTDNYGNEAYRIGELYFVPFDLTEVYKSMFNKYSDTIGYYGGIRNLDKSESLLLEFHNVFLDTPPIFIKRVIKFNDDGSETYVRDIKINMQRDPSWYFDISKKQLKWLADYGEIDDDGEKYFEKTQNLIKTVQEYKLNPNIDSATEDDITRYKKEFVSSPYTENQYYINKPEITRLYFCGTENKEILPGEVKDPFDTITLRATVSSKQKTPLYSFKNIPIESIESKREKLVTLKRDRIFEGYYAVFSPNIFGSNKPEDNLIHISDGQANPQPIPELPTEPPTIEPPIIAAVKIEDEINDPNLRSISVFQGAKQSSNDAKIPPSLYSECEYFGVQLVRSYLDTKDDIDKKTTESTNWFLRTGGAEFIRPKTKYYSGNVSSLLLKRVATCFIIQGHSSSAPDDTSVGQLSNVEVTPEELIYVKNLKKYTKYAGMKILILDACYCLRHYNKWKDVVPTGIILGYHDRVRFDCYGMDKALDLLTEDLNKNKKMTIEEIGIAWKKHNSDIYNQNLRPVFLPWSYSYVYNGNCYYGYLDYEKVRKSRSYPELKHGIKKCDY